MRSAKNSYKKELPLCLKHYILSGADIGFFDRRGWGEGGLGGTQCSVNEMVVVVVGHPGTHPVSAPGYISGAGTHKLPFSCSFWYACMADSF